MDASGFEILVDTVEDADDLRSRMEPRPNGGRVRGGLVEGQTTWQGNSLGRAFGAIVVGLVGLGVGLYFLATDPHYAVEVPVLEVPMSFGLVVAVGAGLIGMYGLYGVGRAAMGRVGDALWASLDGD